MSWLPDTFVAPARLDLTSGHHLRPIRADDIDLDYPAVMGSRARLWSVFGEAWGWPSETMTREQDLDDLVRHAEEMKVNASFNFAIFDEPERALLGCVYVDPPAKQGADAEISWWVVDTEVGGALDVGLSTGIRSWVAADWPFTDPRFIGEDVSWAHYLALPDLEEPPGKSN